MTLEMRETLELRILEEHFGEPFRANEGKLLGPSNVVRRVVLSTNDSRLPRIAELQKFWRRRGSFLFTGWIYHRRYSELELQSAECLKLGFTAVFEPAGEDCGTIYDESCACPHVFSESQTCGAGGRQISDLFLDFRKIPRNKDIARTIADEWIVSQRLAELMIDAKLSGFELRPARHKARFREDPAQLESLAAGRQLLERARVQGITNSSWKFDVWLARPEQHDLAERMWEENVKRKEQQESKRGTKYPTWYQLLITSEPVPVLPPTKFGLQPFDEDLAGRYRCPFGHIAGLNLLSEVTISRGQWDRSDLVRTKEMVGVRGGVLRPHPILVGSPRLRELFSKHSIRGVQMEVVHLA
jgi:hypothetical protein